MEYKKALRSSQSLGAFSFHCLKLLFLSWKLQVKAQTSVANILAMMMVFQTTSTLMTSGVNSSGI
ncbi:hypothetical protein D029_0511 [Vibrio parahaemolyticus 970107]|nr:hypothetical protein D029_0511 [Vibrio parahaemolyticus 970107]